MEASTENQGFAKSAMRMPSKISNSLKAEPMSPPQPSKIPSFRPDPPLSPSYPHATAVRLGGLSEMNDASANARSAMPPPRYNTIKHKPQNLPESEAKHRKTLAERGGEAPNSRIAAPPASKPASNAVKNTIAAGPRGLSNSLSRASSMKSVKHTAPASFSASMGYNPRAQSAQGQRPKSAYGDHHRSKSYNQGPRAGLSTVQQGAASKHEPKVYDDNRVTSLEAQFAAFKQQIENDISQQNTMKDSIKLYEQRNTDLEARCSEYRSLLEEHKTNLSDVKSVLKAAELELENVRRSHSYEIDMLERKHRNKVDDLEDQHKRDVQSWQQTSDRTAEKLEKDFREELEKLLKVHKEELEEMEKRLKTELDDERSQRLRSTQEVQAEYAAKLRDANLEVDAKTRELQLLQGELTNIKAEHDREKLLRGALQTQLTEATARILTLDASEKAMKEKIDFLESDSQAQSQAFNDLHRRMQEAIEAAELANEKLRQEETLRRKLHNQVQELKGNIRVMCRIRPAHATEANPATIDYPDADTDSKEIAVQGPEKTSAMGTNKTQSLSFSFDRVFSPHSQNAEVFEEISQLIQSALDGYNVCIFCYGQTGSGKTYTMSSADGMIPRATAQIYAEATRLQEKGWNYQMEGSFVEVYNETYNDLLGRSEDIDKKKVEVRHDPAKKQTILENTVSVVLDGPDRVEEILQRADKNRTVAATKANMRSSRSHSIFILKLVGVNSITGEKSEGTLNLVDLAGSERLDHSKTEGARLKETQNINKSLSCLGDVIHALGSGKEGAHVPYRNSKLTYLLQYSLGGNSKTLMFVMASPLQAHLQETITSLRFATKVHNTHIGTAKKMTKTAPM